MRVLLRLRLLRLRLRLLRLRLRLLRLRLLIRRVRGAGGRSLLGRLPREQILRFRYLQATLRVQ